MCAKFCQKKKNVENCCDLAGLQQLDFYLSTFLGSRSMKETTMKYEQSIGKTKWVQTSLLEKKASFCSIFAGKCVVNIFLYSHTNALSHSTHILIRIHSMLLPMLFTHGFNFIKFDILRCYKTAYFFICLSLRLPLRGFFMLNVSRQDLRSQVLFFQ